MDHVYSVYRVYGEGDGYSTFDLIAVCTDIHNCLQLIGQLEEHKTLNSIHPVHETMTYENNYTYIGKRKDCSYDCPWSHFGGYIIEVSELNRYLG